MKHTIVVFLLTFLLFAGTDTLANWQDSGIDPEAIIDQILAADQQQREQIQDIVYQSELLEGKWEDDGIFKIEKRFEKTLYVMYTPDTILYRENFLSYYKDDELQSEKELEKAAEKKAEERRKRHTRHIGEPMLEPFYSEHRAEYEINYVGLAEELVDGYRCHQFRVTSRVKDRDHVNGTFYFEVESFHPVRIEFRPADLGGNIGFKLKEMHMLLTYGPTDDNYWLPRQFTLDGKGKAMLVIGVSFAVVEKYTTPRINTGLTLEDFAASND